jgi:hypothetical protein
MEYDNEKYDRVEKASFSLDECIDSLGVTIGESDLVVIPTAKTFERMLSSDVGCLPQQSVSARRGHEQKSMPIEADRVGVRLFLLRVSPDPRAL